MENNQREWLRQLFEKQEWSEEDRRRLLEYLNNTDDAALRGLMEDQFAEAAEPAARPGTEDRLLASIHEKISPAAVQPGARVFLLSGWRKWAVAAVLLLMAGKFLFDRHGVSAKKTSIVTPAAIAASGDRPPGVQNATLTLANGTVISLDSAANGSLARQGNTRVIKLNGQIAYTIDKNGGDNRNGAGDNDVTLLNTISTARGNQYMLVLSDGSKVWLNAASSMKFPTAFRGKERRVEITGEAYFEIADNPAMPFKVVAGGGEVQVLGTHFNVNAYKDETTVRTTLLEGAIAVQKEQSRLVLAPGQQARFNPVGAAGVGTAGGASKGGGTTGSGRAGGATTSGGAASGVGTSRAITLVKDIDPGQETAWKDGFFWFNNTDIHSLMRQVSRWYDVEVSFEGDVTDDGFSGKVSRNVTLSQVLKVLEQYDIHFRIEGKKIIVLP